MPLTFLLSKYAAETSNFDLKVPEYDIDTQFTFHVMAEKSKRNIDKSLKLVPSINVVPNLTSVGCWPHTFEAPRSRGETVVVTDSVYT